MAQASQTGAGAFAEGALSARVPVIVLLLALAIFASRTLSNFVPAFYALADEHGYLTTAKRLATRGELALQQPDAYAFIGETMMQSPADARTYYLRQPIGYPLLCAAAYKVVGPVGPFLVNPLAGVALLVGVYVLGRRFENPLAGALAALVLASHPVMIYYTIKPLSHIADMAAAVWVMVAALGWKQRHKLWQAAVVGLLVGAAILVRYTNVLLVLPLVVIFWSGGRGGFKRLSWQGVVAAIAIGVMLLPLLAYQARAFGSIWRTGYSANGAQTSFSAGYLAGHALAMGQCLMAAGTGLTLLAASALAGLVVLAMRDRLKLAFLLAWALPPLILYTAYYGKPESNLLLYARFGLSSYVPLMLLGLCWPADLRWGGRERQAWAIGSAVPIVLSAGAILWSASDATMAGKLQETRDTLVYAQAAGDLALGNVPPGAVILADNHLQYYLEYATDCVIYSAETFRADQLQKRLADLDQTPQEFDPARTRQLAALLGGRNDEQLAQILRTRLAEYAASGRRVFVLCSRESAVAWRERLRGPAKLMAENPLSVGVYEMFDF